MSKRLILIAMAIVSGIGLTEANAELRIHIIDVGQGASALVELDHAAILIDAGGEDTGNDRDAASIRGALTALFARRIDLHNTLEAVIVSHPHIDHTKNLMMVMQEFTVRALVENGDKNKHSGTSQLNDARAFAKTKKIPNIKVKDKSVPAAGRVLKLSPGGESGAQILLLSGFRGCGNPNNDSIAVLIKDGSASALFAGDAENDDDSGPCQSEPLLQHLVKRFGQSGLLETKLYHATHHGSHNGVLQSAMEKARPAASVISVGRLNLENRTPGDFHAFQFGHPRKAAIDSLIANTSGSRPAKQITFMTEDGGHHPDATPTTLEIEKAVYCTCWDGNIDITFTADGAPRVEPLGSKHASGDTPDSVPPPPPTSTPSCTITPADVVTPVIKPPDFVNQKPADYFMLSLSWSPQFCTTGAGKSAANAFQCKENSFGMVVHGLWPQSSTAANDKQHPRNCKTTTPIASATLRQHLCTVPGVQLQQDEWAKHGTCAFDAPEKYLDTIEKLMSELRVPDLDALAAAKGNNLQARDVIGAFLSANTGITAPGIQLLLGGKNLQEVHVCYDLDLKFRKCDTKSTVKDTAKVTVRPRLH